MGKKQIQTKDRIQRTSNPKQKVNIHRSVPNFSISDKSYVKFFQFLKDLHSSQRQREALTSQATTSLATIITSIMNFVNYQKHYMTKQLECSFICLANIFSVIGNNILKLYFESQFVFKIRKFLNELAKNPKSDGFQQKMQAILYVLALLVYKQRVGGQRTIRQLNNSIFHDRAIVNLLLGLILPKQERKIGKFYGIIIIYIYSKSVNTSIKKKLVKSVLLNFCTIGNELTLLNLLVLLRSEKNKVSLCLQDIQKGKIFQILIKAYPNNIHHYKSFYILDYLHHLLSLFPLLASTFAESSFLHYLLQKTEPAYLHHPLHSSLIIEFIERTLKCLPSAIKDRVLKEILKIQLKNNEIFLKLTQMLVNLQQFSATILKITLTGYFQPLLSVIRKESQINLKVKAAELYINIFQRVNCCNESLSEYLRFKIRNVIESLTQENKKHISDLLNTKLQRASQFEI